MYDLTIIGGGPGGVAAGIYAARKKINTLILTDNFGGQSLVSSSIENWIGTKSVSGFDFGKMLEDHLRSEKDSIEIIDGDLATKISKSGEGFVIETEGGKKFESHAVLITSGSHHKKLNVPGEDRLNGKGVAYCATCDAPIFKDKVVAVIGGGNSALEACVDFFPYAKEIYLMVRSNMLKGDPITQDQVKTSSKVKIIYNAETQEILGDEFVSGLKYKDKISGEIKELPVQGVLVAIGAIPNSDLVKELVQLNEYGEIIVDHKTQKTSMEGIWAAGDVTDVLYKQNNISAGDAIKAVLNIYDYLNKNKK